MRLERQRSWQCSHPGGPSQSVEKLDFYLKKGLVVSSISLAVHKEWIARGLGVVAQGREG